MAMGSKMASQRRRMRAVKQDRASQVYEALKQRILNFHLSPGVKISDKEVAHGMGLSRTPVREALSRLAEQGLVESRPNRGFTVKVFSRKEVEDHYMLRESLESLAVTLTSQRLDKERIKILRDLVEGYPTLMKSQNLARFNDADEQFHDLIALYSGNSALYEALRNLQGKIRIIRRYDHIRSTSFQETYDEHRQILNHMIKGDVAKARKAMSDHILTSMKTVMKTLPD
jgi:DNA-binding GntR family transcriptional regulator